MMSSAGVLQQAPLMETNFGSSSALASSLLATISTKLYARLYPKTVFAYSSEPSFKNFLSVDDFSTKSVVFLRVSSFSWFSFSSWQSFTFPWYCSIFVFNVSIFSLITAFSFSIFCSSVSSTTSSGTSSSYFPFFLSFPPFLAAAAAASASYFFLSSSSAFNRASSASFSSLSRSSSSFFRFSSSNSSFVFFFCLPFFYT